MSWSGDQWAQFCALLDHGWPGDFTVEQAKAYRALLDISDPQVMLEALRRLLHGGQRFRPSVAELLAAARRDPAVPTFDEAYRLIFGPGGVFRTGRTDDVHPLVLAFVERQGPQRLRTLPLEDPEWGHRHRTDLQRAWEAHVDAFDGREVAALAAGTGQDGLHRLDPLAALTGPRRELEAGT